MELYNIESERSVLATLMTEPQFAGDLIAILGKNPKVFYLHLHQQIYKAILDNLEQGKPIDPVSVGAELQRKGMKGFAQDMYDMIAELIAPENARYHAQIVSDMFKRRMILSIASDAIAAVKQGEEPDVVLGKLSSDIQQLGAVQEARGALKEVAKEFIKMLDLRAKGEWLGLRTGFPSFDENIGGFAPGEFIILAGRPSHGKTALMLNYALNIAESGKRVGLVSLEMDRVLIFERLLSIKAQVPLNKLRAGVLSEDEWTRVNQASDYLSRLDLLIAENAIEPFEVELFVRSNELDICFIDYIQLMRSSAKQFRDRNAELTDISRSLKRLATSRRIPVVALCQLNRAIEGRADKEFMLSDLRDSGSLEQDADVVMFIKRPFLFNEDEYRDDPALTKLIVKKNRNGPSGLVFTLHFMAPIMTFIEKGCSHDTGDKAGADSGAVALF